MRIMPSLRYILKAPCYVCPRLPGSIPHLAVEMLITRPEDRRLDGTCSDDLTIGKFPSPDRALHSMVKTIEVE